MTDLTVDAVTAVLDAIPTRAGTPGIPARAGVRVSEGDDAIMVDLDDRAYLTMAMLALVGRWRCDYSGNTIVVTADTDWYPRTRRSAGDLDPDALVLAWCVREWGTGAGGPEGPYTQLWRHVLECDTVTGDTEFTVVEDGACETCHHEYPAIAYHVTCGCGLIRLGTAKDPYHVRSYGPAHTLSSLLREVEDLREEYLASDQSHPSWVPGISKVPAKRG